MIAGLNISCNEIKSKDNSGKSSCYICLIYKSKEDISNLIAKIIKVSMSISKVLYIQYRI